MSLAHLFQKPSAAARSASRAWRLLSALALSVALVGATACGDDDDDGGGGTAGTYALRTVDGQPVPITVSGAVVQSGSMTLNANNTYALRVLLTSGGQNVNWTDDGDWTQNGSGLTFTSDTFGDSFAGNLAGGAMTVQYEFTTGVTTVLVFRK